MITFETFVDAAGGFRWRMVDSNHRIVGSSGESFTRERDAKRAAEQVITDIRDEHPLIDKARKVSR